MNAPKSANAILSSMTSKVRTVDLLKFATLSNARVVFCVSKTHVRVFFVSSFLPRDATLSERGYATVYIVRLSVRNV